MNRSARACEWEEKADTEDFSHTDAECSFLFQFIVPLDTSKERANIVNV